jgi:lipopolysaccharide export system protein LptA
VLTSKIGHYFTNVNEFFFKNDVVLVNPKYTINSDTMMFNTKSEIAYFYGPTHIVSKENTIYCENGWYNTKTDISQFSKNAWLQTENQHLDGDSLYYNRKIKFGKAFNNVTLVDSAQNIIITANYIENDELRRKSMAKDSVLAIFIDKGDSLYLHADTIRAKYDSANNIELIRAYHKVKFFRADLQGMCDSVSFIMKDSIMYMYYEPVIWTDDNQLTADTIQMISGKEEMKEMYMLNNAFIISQSDTNQFNQVKGKNMHAYFNKNQLYKVYSKGNAETIYYMKEEGSEDLLGINKAISSDLLMFIKDKKMETITFIKSPEGTLYPVNELAQADRFLKNFKWRIQQRPKEKMDVFIWK